jgi:hypothetical protein
MMSLVPRSRESSGSPGLLVTRGNGANWSSGVEGADSGDVVNHTIFDTHGVYFSEGISMPPHNPLCKVGQYRNFYFVKAA